MLYLYKQRET